MIAGIHAYLACTSSNVGSSSWISPRADCGVWRDDRDSAPWFGGDPHGPASTGSAAVHVHRCRTFSTIRSRHARIPQEAIIGISYAVASAATILALSKSSAEGEHPGHARGQHPGGFVEEVWRTAIQVIMARSTDLPEKVPCDFDESRCRGDVHVVAAMGLPVLRLVWFRGDLASVAIAGVPLVSLPDCSVAAMLFADRIDPSPGDRLTMAPSCRHWRVSVVDARSANRRADHRAIRRRPRADGHCPRAGAGLPPSPFGMFRREGSSRA